MFALFVALVIPALPELSKIDAPTRLIFIAAIIITSIPCLTLLYWLGKLEERQQEKHDTKMIKDLVKELGYERRQTSDSEHFQSVL